MQHFDLVSLTFSSKKEFIPVVGAAILKYAMLSGFSAKDSQRICLAFEEASTYSISLGFGREDDLLRVRLSRTTLGLHIVVRSKGLPLEDDALPAFDQQRFVVLDDSTGLNSFLARHMVDDVVFSLLEGGDREISLVKYRPVNLQENDPCSPGRSSRSPGRRTLTSHVIRLAEPEDCEGIARLALRAHGSVFFNESIYYPARVREMLEQKKMFSMVAETPGGELMAHCALVADTSDALVREWTYLFSDPRFKSPGCIKDMGAFAIERAKSLELYAIRALAVTNHTYAQQNALQQGHKESALLLAASPASKAWQNKKDAPGRISNVVQINYLHEGDEALLHVPQRHQPMVEQIFQNLKKNRRFCLESEQGLPEGPALLSLESDLKEGWSYIVVSQYGRDIMEQLNRQLTLSCRHGIPVTLLTLPLTDPVTCTVADLIEKIGFFFAGVDLTESGQEVLMFQHVHGVDLDWDSIHMASPFGRKLLEYVRSIYPGPAQKVD